MSSMLNPWASAMLVAVWRISLAGAFVSIRPPARLFKGPGVARTAATAVDEAHHASSPPPAVFCNRELTLKRMEAIGECK